MDKFENKKEIFKNTENTTTIYNATKEQLNSFFYSEFLYFTYSIEVVTLLCENAVV